MALPSVRTLRTSKVVFFYRRIGKSPGVAPAEHITTLEESLLVYAELIESFERARERMLTRRRGATDLVMVRLDESLALNRRMLDSLKNVLKTASTQLEQEKRGCVYASDCARDGARTKHR
jgi:hypothetical protein